MTRLASRALLSCRVCQDSLRGLRLQGYRRVLGTYLLGAELRTQRIPHLEGLWRLSKTGCQTLRIVGLPSRLVRLRNVRDAARVDLSQRRKALSRRSSQSPS